MKVSNPNLKVKIILNYDGNNIQMLQLRSDITQDYLTTELRCSREFII